MMVRSVEECINRSHRFATRFASDVLLRGPRCIHLTAEEEDAVCVCVRRAPALPPIYTPALPPIYTPQWLYPVSV